MPFSPFLAFASSPCIARIIWNKVKLVLLTWKQQLFSKDLDEKSVLYSMQCSGLNSINPPVITISCQAGGSRRKWQPSPFALNYFLLVVWKLLWILLKTPPPSRRKLEVGKKPKLRKKVEKWKIAEHEICIELFGLGMHTLRIKTKSAIIV